MKQLWILFRSTVLCLLSLAAVLILMALSGIGCPIRYLTGISCPGCGMTRAVWHLLTLNLPAAMAYHPLCVAMPPVAGLLILFTVYPKPRARHILLWVTAAALLAVYLWRLLAGEGDVVVFDPQNGLIGRIITHFINNF